MTKEISIDLSDVKRPLVVEYSPEEYPGFKGGTFRATIKGYTISLTRGQLDNATREIDPIWGLAFGGEGEPDRKTFEEMQQMLLDDIPEEKTYWDDSGLQRHEKGGNIWWSCPGPQGFTIRQFNKHFIAVVQNDFGGGEAEFYESFSEARDASFSKARKFNRVWSNKDSVPPILAFPKQQAGEVKQKLISGIAIGQPDSSKVFTLESRNNLIALALEIAKSPEEKGKVLISSFTFQKIGSAMERICSLQAHVGNHAGAKNTRELYSKFKDSAEKIDAEGLGAPKAD